MCIYHKNCADGFGAALAVKLFLDPNQEFEYLAANYGDEAPCVKGKDVYIVDYSYPRDVLIKMHKEANSILVLDHHESAEANLKGLDFCKFDITKSGALMAWEEFSNNKEVPDLIKYIEDRDLWRWALPQSKEYSAALQLKKMSFDGWAELLDNEMTGKMINDGKMVLAYQNAEIKRALKKDVEMVNIGGHIVPCINATHLISEIGSELSKGHPFAAMFFDTNDKRVFSLRSAKDGINVSKVAKSFGGGGHFHAAGFTIDKPKTQFSIS